MEGSAAAIVLRSIDSSANNATNAHHAVRQKPRIDRECKPIIEPAPVPFLPNSSGAVGRNEANRHPLHSTRKRHSPSRSKTLDLMPAPSSAVARQDSRAFDRKDPNFRYGSDTMLSCHVRPGMMFFADCVTRQRHVCAFGTGELDARGLLHSRAISRWGDVVSHWRGFWGLCCSWSAKFAKALIGVGAPWSTVLGHELELIPLDDPSALRPGKILQIRLLFRGSPRAGRRCGDCRRCNRQSMGLACGA